MRTRLAHRLGLVPIIMALACATGAAQPAYNPHEALDRFSPAMAQLRKDIRKQLGGIAQQLTQAEVAGRDMSCPRQALTELQWRLGSTTDVEAARKTLARVVDLASQARPPSGRQQAEDGSYGACVEPWFFRVDFSSDYLLDPNGWPGRIPPRFLDRINHPAALARYLEGILVSDIAREGVAHRKELNEVTSTLVRVILRGRPVTYPFHALLKSTMRAFVASWQEPDTGFFGAWYRDGYRIIKTVDLSMTFHMASYTNGEISYWPQLIDTLLRIKDQRYPNGWLEDDGMSNHNNYDVVRLFRLGWPKMRGDQKRQARLEVQRMLDWFLTMSIAPDGQIVRGGSDDDSRADTYYFAVSFLDDIGYFDRHKRFWTDTEFPGAVDVRTRLLGNIKRLDQKDPIVKSTREKLGG